MYLHGLTMHYEHNLDHDASSRLFFISTTNSAERSAKSLSTYLRTLSTQKICKNVNMEPPLLRFRNTHYL